MDELATEHDRAIGLGAKEFSTANEDAEEPLYVFADPSGHPFCIFVAQVG